MSKKLYPTIHLNDKKEVVIGELYIDEDKTMYEEFVRQGITMNYGNTDITAKQLQIRRYSKEHLGYQTHDRVANLHVFIDVDMYKEVKDSVRAEFIRKLIEKHSAFLFSYSTRSYKNKEQRQSYEGNYEDRIRALGSLIAQLEDRLAIRDSVIQFKNEEIAKLKIEYEEVCDEQATNLCGYCEKKMNETSTDKLNGIFK